MTETIYYPNTTQRMYVNEPNHKKAYYITGELQCETNIKDGDGSDIGFYRSGQKQWEFNYVDGYKEGFQKGYFESAKIKDTLQISFMENYKYGKKEGFQYDFYSNGTKMHVWNYINGKKEGIQTSYDKDGSIYCKHLYKEDKYISDETLVK